MTFTFSLESSSRGYHEYQSIWPNTTVDDELICEREVGNPHDTHAVAIKKDISGVLTTVGHTPRKISKVSYVFIRRGGTIQGRVNVVLSSQTQTDAQGLIACSISTRAYTASDKALRVSLGLATRD